MISCPRALRSRGRAPAAARAGGGAEPRDPRGAGAALDASTLDLELSTAAFLLPCQCCGNLAMNLATVDEGVGVGWSGPWVSRLCGARERTDEPRETWSVHSVGRHIVIYRIYINLATE